MENTKLNTLIFFVDVTIQKICESDLQWGRPLGQGSYGMVMQAKWKNGPPSCEDVAVKIMSSTNSNVEKEVCTINR